MREKIFRVMPAGIKMELVRDLLGYQLFVHLLCGGCKSVFVLLSAINVDRLSSDLRFVFARQEKWIVLVPMRNINWIAEHTAQQFGQRSGVVKVSIQFARRFCHQRGTLRAHRSEKLGMRKGEAQRSVTPHGKPGDPSRLAFANHAILGFDKRQELCEKKIAVAIMFVGRIDEKTAAAFRCNYQEVADLVIAPQVLDQAPATALEQSLLVLSEPVQKIKNGILCLG